MKDVRDMMRPGTILKIYRIIQIEKGKFKRRETCRKVKSLHTHLVMVEGNGPGTCYTYNEIYAGLMSGRMKLITPRNIAKEPQK